jgi:hypothetical protein
MSPTQTQCVAPLFELHGLGFCKNAFHALVGALVVAYLIGRFSARQKHQLAACGAAALAYWRLSRNKATRKWHSGNPS